MAPTRMACYAAMTEAVAYARAGHGPALVHGHVVRPYSHSLSDDERQYRSEEEVQAENARDPIAKMQMWLLREGILDAEGINRLEQKVDEEVQRAADRAMQAVLPSAKPEAILRHQYSEDLKPTDARFDTQPEATADTSERTMAELINLCLKDEMRRDERIVVFGEDVADATRDEALRAGKIKGKGGVFKLTAGLQTEFGSDRCFNSPLAEANIVGRAIGMAVRGLKPVVEIQFFDYIWPAVHQMRNELSADPLAVERTVELPAGHPRAHRRLSHRRLHLSLAVGREHLHPHARHTRGHAVECAGRAGTAAHRHPLRRPGALPGAQAPVSRDLWPRRLSRAGVCDPLRQGQRRARRQGPHRRHLRRPRSARLAGGGQAAARDGRARSS